MRIQYYNTQIHRAAFENHFQKQLIRHVCKVNVIICSIKLSFHPKYCLIPSLCFLPPFLQFHHRFLLRSHRHKVDYMERLSIFCTDTIPFWESSILYKMKGSWATFCFSIFSKTRTAA